MEQTERIPNSQRKLAALTDMEVCACGDVDFDGCAVAKEKKAFQCRMRRCANRLKRAGTRNPKSGVVEIATLIDDSYWKSNPQTVRARLFIAALLIREHPDDDEITLLLYKLVVRLAKPYMWRHLRLVSKAERTLAKHDEQDEN